MTNVKTLLFGGLNNWIDLQTAKNTIYIRKSDLQTAKNTIYIRKSDLQTAKNTIYIRKSDKIHTKMSVMFMVYLYLLTKTTFLETDSKSHSFVRILL